mgnify:CR=1 FL=1
MQTFHSGKIRCGSRIAYLEPPTRWTHLSIGGGTSPKISRLRSAHACQQVSNPLVCLAEIMSFAQRTADFVERLQLGIARVLVKQ